MLGIPTAFRLSFWMRRPNVKFDFARLITDGHKYFTGEKTWRVTQKCIEPPRMILAHTMITECFLGLSQFFVSSKRKLNQCKMQDSNWAYLILFSIFRDDQIRAKCGDDAVQYLSFQRHLIVLTTIITLISLGVALPLNFQGNLKGDEKQFGHTTLSNLDPDSWYLWIHVGLSILFVPVAIYIMRHFSIRLEIPEVEATIPSRTLMFSKIPRRQCNKADLLQHFKYIALVSVDFMWG